MLEEREGEGSVQEGEEGEGSIQEGEGNVQEGTGCQLGRASDASS